LPRTAQVRRAASSVCANIAEGCGRRGTIDFARYLQIAFGSLCDAVIEVKRMLAISSEA
jgi:four helix bundle protein